jgi:hypothetical protein
MMCRGERGPATPTSAMIASASTVIEFCEVVARAQEVLV